jgi:hypothetical protein
MKHVNLIKAVALSSLGIFGAFMPAIAQTPVYENISKNIGGTRLVVLSPSSITGIKKVNLASWGAAVSPTIVGASVQKAYDTLGAATLLNGTGSYPSLVGKFALIYRGGGVSFSQKVNYCVAAGAVGVIIVNNVPGDPVGMAATPTGSTSTVPVMMVSDVDGNAMNDQIKASVPVTITVGTWNTGGAHDLGILPAYQNTPHAMNIPLSQMAGSATTEAYKQYVGGAIANYGTNTETGITVTDSVMWTPTSGSPSYITSNTYTVPSISVTDSIKFGFGSAGSAYSLTAPTTTGRYDHKYSLSYGSTDAFPQDNVTVLTQYISDSIFCKGNYDYVNHRPFVTQGIQVSGGTTPFLMGNMYYVKNGGYAAKQVQFSLSVNTDPTLAFITTGVTVNLYKWVDGAGGGSLDSFVQAGELTRVAVAIKNFTTADSSGKMLTLDFRDFSTGSLTPPILVENNTWYYVEVEVPTTCFIGMDQSINFYSRSFAQHKNIAAAPATGIYDNAVGFFNSDNDTYIATATNSLAPYPFSSTAAYGNNFNVDSIFFDKYNEVPSIAFLLSSAKPSSIKNVPSKEIGDVNIYPNPAVNGTTTVDIKLAAKSNKVVYKITDVLGHSVYTEVHDNILNDNFQLNTSKYSSGNYYLIIATDDNFAVRKLTIQN